MIFSFVFHNERNKKERETETEMRRQHHRMARTGVWRFQEGSGKQRRVKRYCSNDIYDTPTTVMVKVVRRDGKQGPC